MDLATADEEPVALNHSHYPKQAKQQIQGLYGTSGRGNKGAITEYRTGIRAAIGLDIEFGEPTQRCWALSSYTLHSHGLDDGLHILVGLIDSSALLHLTADLSEATMVEADVSPFDHTVRTLEVVQREDGVIIQVTETAVVVIGPSGRRVL